MEPTLIVQPDANIPKIDMDALGDPLAKSALASNGTGAGAESAAGKAAESALGSGARPGSGGNMGGGAYKIGGGVSAPTLLYKGTGISPRRPGKRSFKARLCSSWWWWMKNGKARDIRVIRPLGLALTRRPWKPSRNGSLLPASKDAVSRWPFKLPLKSTSGCCDLARPRSSVVRLTIIGLMK